MSLARIFCSGRTGPSRNSHIQSLPGSFIWVFLWSQVSCGSDLLLNIYIFSKENDPINTEAFLVKVQLQQSSSKEPSKQSLLFLKSPKEFRKRWQFCLFWCVGGWRRYHGILHGSLAHQGRALKVFMRLCNTLTFLTLNVSLALYLLILFSLSTLILFSLSTFDPWNRGILVWGLEL